MLTEEQEDYLKAIFGLNGTTDYVSNKNLAQDLNIKPSSVSEMMLRLKKDDYVDIRPYKGVKLTQKGLDHTTNIIKRHRLIERFLIEELEYTWDEVHGEAEILEHRVSDRFIDKIDKLMGYPTTCPHGGIIPRENQIEEIYNTSLNDFEIGDDVEIKRVMDYVNLLDYLSNQELHIGDVVTISNKDSLNQLIELKLKDKTIMISETNASYLFGIKTA
ncbi:metal-dependent transcriptional regulator [Mammaliicoccus sciuri]|jgi:DtxR family Mn-dependent transcriptional regulator|uniref:metal-dependent transcriptional regulator n=1 Tax=Mammaliicoccus sciuri TaxID=1296 RepID=UPI000734B713|nr:metal-dependent transcriptional regulator [Mammaliicoccus sciuri]KTT84246.1 DtxR family transcriptional regulator [Mammaliicoccus sciuri]MBA1397858.1 metal-dependent transcriptional regulator [Mammaliicoccus sciuri]MBF0718133.1 metal-dependent transcriptional regulator [Mammaliicoccus sciuri]MBG9206756.1 metal-dependent transcriptional regulator [Mammaliicoccus sciuri]MBG9211418.1 metal-dependent transcriptional regulator [Mammaliicoccus sciuri]